MGTLLSEAARDKQDDDDDQDDANETVAAVTIAVSGAAETATEATKQEDDEDYDEDGSERMTMSLFLDLRAPRLLLKGGFPDRLQIMFRRYYFEGEWRKSAPPSIDVSGISSAYFWRGSHRH